MFAWLTALCLAASPSAPAASPPAEPIPKAATPEEIEAVARAQRVAEYFREHPPDALAVAGLAPKAFLGALAEGDVDRAVRWAGIPFFLEGQLYGSRAALAEALAQALATRGTRELELLDLQLFTPEQMRARHGPPPARLKGWPWLGPGRYVAVANLSGRGAVLLVVPGANASWLVAGYTD